MEIDSTKGDSLNIYGLNSGMGKDLLSSYMQLANQSPARDRIWAQVRQDLTRLSAGPTRDLRDLSVDQWIQVIEESESMFFKDAADRWGKRYMDIKRYRRVGTALFACILQREGIVPKVDPLVDQDKYTQLTLMHQEVDMIHRVLRKKPVKDQLQQMPDLKGALAGFQEYSTVRYFLEDNCVPHNPDEMHHYNANIRDYLFTKRTSRLGQFLRKVTLSRWFFKDTNWHDRGQNEVNKMINSSAAIAYRTPSPDGENEIARARHLRFFLEKLMAWEFVFVQQDIDSWHNYTLDETFVPINGHISEPGDIDIAKTFDLFEDVSYCPQALRLLVKEYIEGADSLQSFDHFALDKFNDPFYKLEYRKKWVRSGLSFLENVLFLSSRGEVPGWEDFTVSRREKLKQFRDLFQRNLPAGRIRS